MTKRLSIRMPGSHTAPYKAAEHLFKNGPMTQEQLFLAVDMGCVPCRRDEKLQHAITSGLITQMADGKLDCSAEVRVRFEEKLNIKPDEKLIGQITPAQYRPSVFASQGISKKNIPNRRGLRPVSDSAPAWSVRETVSIKSIAGGKA